MAEFTLKERDRRWAAVASGADGAGLGGVLIPLGNGLDARYLTQIRGSIVVIPTVGQAVAVTDRRQTNTWLPTPRHTVRDWAGPTVWALVQADLVGKRIGVAGLNRGRWSHAHARNGVVVHSAFHAVRQALPSTTFVDATDIVGAIRSVKSAEEIDRLERAARMAHAGLDQVKESAHVGARETDVFATAVRALLERGSDYRDHVLTVDGMAAPVPGRTLGTGSILTAGMIGVSDGYMSTETRSFVLGGAGKWRAASDALGATFDALLTVLRAGTPFGELRKAATASAHSEKIAVTLDIRGSGLGDDGPILQSQESPDAEGVSLSDGNALQIMVRARPIDSKFGLEFGTTIVVNGAEPRTADKGHPAGATFIG